MSRHSARALWFMALAPATRHLLPAPAGPDILSAVWEQLPEMLPRMAAVAHHILMSPSSVNITKRMGW